MKKWIVRVFLYALAFAAFSSSPRPGITPRPGGGIDHDYSSIHINGFFRVSISCVLIIDALLSIISIRSKGKPPCTDASLRCGSNEGDSTTRPPDTQG